MVHVTDTDPYGVRERLTSKLLRNIAVWSSLSIKDAGRDVVVQNSNVRRVSAFGEDRRWGSSTLATGSKHMEHVYG
jgi:hypothetical protein